MSAFRVYITKECFVFSQDYLSNQPPRLWVVGAIIGNKKLNINPIMIN